MVVALDAGAVEIDLGRHAADPVVALEHRHAMAQLGKLVGGGEAHRSGADHRRSGPCTVSHAEPCRSRAGWVLRDAGMPTPEGTPLRSRLVAWGFFVLLVALSTRLMASAVRRGVLLTEESPLLYHAATLGFNYFDFGFVRRGLAGSIVSLLGPDRLLGHRGVPRALRCRRGGGRRDPVPAPAPARRRTRGLRAAVRRAHVALGRRPGPDRSRRCRAVDRRRAGFSGEEAGAVVPVCRAQPGRARDGTRLRAVAACRTASRWRALAPGAAAHRRGGPDGPRGLRCALCAARHAAARRRSDDGVGRAFSFSDRTNTSTGRSTSRSAAAEACGPRSARTSATRRIPCTWQRVWA